MAGPSRSISIMRPYYRTLTKEEGEPEILKRWGHGWEKERLGV